MAEYKGKDADLSDIYFGASGGGTTGDPFFGIPADFYLEVAKGNVVGHSLKVVRGHNGDIDIGTEDVWEAGGSITYLTSAETMEIASSDANDTSAGTGARTLLLEGVDGTGAYASETITLNGTTDVTSSNSYLRVNFMTLQTAGTTGYNVGNITATATTAATIQDEMDATEGVSQSSHHTVPLGKKCYIVKVEVNCAKISGGGGSPEVEFRGYSIPFGGARLQLFDKRLDTSVTDELDISLPFPVEIAARSDIYFTAETDVNNTDARTRMYCVQIDD